MERIIKADVSSHLQDAVTKYSTTPLADPNFDLAAWSAKHLTASEEVAKRWIAKVKAEYGNSDKVMFGCVGYW